MRRSLALLPVVLAACVVEGPLPDRGLPNPPLPPEGACGAADLQYLVGQPADTLDGMRFDTPVRIIEPGMAVTMDYSPERLNIQIGENGRIDRVSCG